MKGNYIFVKCILRKMLTGSPRSSVKEDRKENYKFKMTLFKFLRN